MGNQHDGFAALAEIDDRRSQCLLAGFVQIRIGFVEHQQRRVAIHGPGQTNALFLATGQTRPAITERRVVALGELKNHFMYACAHGRLNHLLRVNFAESANVLIDGSCEEFNVLRQITDGGAQLVLVPLIDIGAVEPNLADRCRPDTHQQPRQCGLA